MLSIISHALLGLLVSYVGFVNTFWGNDPFYGLIIFSMAVFFYYPLLAFLNRIVPAKVRTTLLVAIAIFVFFSSLGVGELGDKIELMKMTFPIPNITGI